MGGLKTVNPGSAHHYSLQLMGPMALCAYPVGNSLSEPLISGRRVVLAGMRLPQRDGRT